MSHQCKLKKKKNVRKYKRKSTKKMVQQERLDRPAGSTVLKIILLLSTGSPTDLPHVVSTVVVLLTFG